MSNDDLGYSVLVSLEHDPWYITFRLSLIAALFILGVVLTFDDPELVCYLPDGLTPCTTALFNRVCDELYKEEHPLLLNTWLTLAAFMHLVLLALRNQLLAAPRTAIIHVFSLIEKLSLSEATMKEEIKLGDEKSTPLLQDDAPQESKHVLYRELASRIRSSALSLWRTDAYNAVLTATLGMFCYLMFSVSRTSTAYRNIMRISRAS